ncbi:MAG: DMT family transporter [Candidatus Cloacimonetes bacterium]|nr:DMT family transporter [Candidatus Cloacimonadota bacterium]
MRLHSILELIVLAAMWGASFLFIKVAAPEFGPVPLILLRVGLASLFLLPLFCLRHRFLDFWPYRWHLVVVGLLNSALPFCLLAWAAASVPAGFLAVMNATAPLFAALVAWVWCKQTLSRWQIAGMFIGVLGVVVLVSSRLEVSQTGPGVIPSVIKALLATFLYGIAANYTKVYLSQCSSLLIATGGQVIASITLLPFAIFLWPDKAASAQAWYCAWALAVISTAIGFLLYYRLIAGVGPTKAIAVTFLVPVFGLLWGYVFLNETLTLYMLMGAAIIFLGTALATGILRPRQILL